MTDENREEFLQLLLPQRDRLMHFARGMTRDMEEARDLVGDVILAALEGFQRLRSRDAFLGYLFTIAVRIHRRRRWRRRIFGTVDDPDELDRPDSSQSPDVGTDIEALHRALDLLPEKVREAVVLHEISGLRVEEIRQIQGGSLSGVKSRLARGRQRLAELLGVVPSEFEAPVHPETHPTRRPDNDGRPVVLYSQSQTHG